MLNKFGRHWLHLPEKKTYKVISVVITRYSFLNCWSEGALTRNFLLNVHLMNESQMCYFNVLITDSATLSKAYVIKGNHRQLLLISFKLCFSNCSMFVSSGMIMRFL